MSKAKLKDLLAELKKEINYAFALLNMYSQLISKENIQLMNGSAPGFFSLVIHSLIAQTMLQIAKMTDNKITCGKENLTFDLVIERLKKEKGDNQYTQDLEKKYKTMIKNKLTEDVRQIRNKKLAHLDKKTVLEENELPKMTINQIDSVLDELSALHRKICEYCDIKTIHPDGIMIDGDATELMRILMEWKDLKAKDRQVGLGGRR